jgi:hypothetical protein
MSEVERWGRRPGAYSDWHRGLGVIASMIDLDVVEHCLFCEYCTYDTEILALCETAVDVGQTTKPTYVLQALARRADVPAWLILYRPNPNYREDQHWPYLDRIVGARIAQVWPVQELLHVVSAEELGRLIVSWHRNCRRCAARQEFQVNGRIHV